MRIVPNGMTLSKSEAKAFLDGNGKRGRKAKYPWAKIVHQLLAGARVADVAKEYKMATSYVSNGAKKYAKAVLSGK